MTIHSLINRERLPWPLQMRAETAAAYCDEVSELAFLRAVDKGLYPKPVDVPGKGHRWLKSELKAAIKRIHGKGQPADAGGGSLVDLV